MSSSSNSNIQSEEDQQDYHEQIEQSGEISEESTHVEECEVRNFLTEADDELLISLVSARPPLFDLRLPLKEPSREIVQTLWEEVVSELNSKFFMT